jgi:hypothetical protein
MPSDSDERKSQPIDGRLDRLLREYRESVPDSEPSAWFMPRLWERIEKQQSVASSLNRLAPLYAMAAAVLCVVLGVALLALRPATSVAAERSYVEALADDESGDAPEYARVVLVEGQSER